MSAAAGMPIVPPDIALLMVKWRREVHRLPELAFAEHLTTALIRRELDAIGMAEVALPTATGAAFAIEPAQPAPGGLTRPCVLVRADIDALPIEEATGLSFTSAHPGVMHACGHDAHTALLLGLGHLLMRSRSSLQTRVVLLFQPAEEVLSGAKAVLADGLLDRCRIDAVLTAHVVPMMPPGQVAMRSGVQLAGAIGFQVDVAGSAGHGAVRRVGGDALAAGAAMVAALSTAVSDPVPDAVAGPTLPSVAICQFQAGSAPNVTAAAAMLTGVLRYPQEPDTCWERLRSAMATVARDHGVTAQIHSIFDTPPVVNDPALSAVVAAAISDRLPAGCLRWLPGPLPVSDDAAELLRLRPGVYLMLGAAAADPARGVPHSGRFDIDESVLTEGLRILLVALESIAGELGSAPGAK